MLPKSITYSLNEDGETYNVDVKGVELFDSTKQENIVVNYNYPKVIIQALSMFPFLPQGSQEILSDIKDVIWNMNIQDKKTN